MKYMINHNTTRHLLQEWAGQNTLVSASFYFYYLGSDLQKSIAGVLRSLLHTILYRNRNVVQLAFPRRLKALSMSPENQRHRFEPTTFELQRALKDLIKSCPTTYIFLAIDGLDEYNATSEKMRILVSTFKQLTAFLNVKALLSSRPWTVFEQSFSGCPQLILHHLTAPDITRFVHDEVGKHAPLQIISPKNRQNIDTLTTEIVEAASGVFL